MVHDHCSICRRASGAAFVTWAGVHENQFSVQRGAEYLSVYKSSQEAERQFCNCCGSQLIFRSHRWPNEVHFTVATLVGNFSEKPTKHVFYNDRVAWIDDQESLPKHGGNTGLDPL